MEFLHHILDIFLHLDKHLAEIVQAYGTQTYTILFCVIFCETGLVVTPFLPGDSLLFAVGALTAAGVMPLPVALVYLLPVLDGDLYRAGLSAPDGRGADG